MKPMPIWPILVVTVCYVVAVGSWCAMVWDLSRMVWDLRGGVSTRGSMLLWSPSAAVRTASFSTTGQTCWARAKHALAAWVIAVAGGALVAMLGSAP
jgi:hypothetical protein